MSIDDIAIRLKNARRNCNLTQAEVARRLGITYQAVSNYERGVTRVDTDTLVKLCAIYGIRISSVIGPGEADEDSVLIPGILPLPTNKAYPLLGDIACGTPILAEQNIAEYIQFPDDLKADFCLRCKGDSMIDAHISDGDIVFIREQPEVENGQIAAVLIDGEATLKRVYLSGDTLTLMSANASYPPMVYSGEQLADARILGRAVNYLTNVK